MDEAITEIEQVLALPELNFSLPSKKEADSTGAAYSTKAGLDNLNTPVDAPLSGGAGGSGSGSGLYSDALRLTDDDRVGAFVCYASLLGRARRMKEANKVLSHAKVMFAGSAQEVQVLVAASQLFVEKGDFDAAIRMLDKISEESSTFARAQLIKADIVLNHNHDKEGFTKCYQQLADKEPTAKNFALLGEAYLRILNPEAAIDALEQAYKLDPKNGRLRGRIGEIIWFRHIFLYTSKSCDTHYALFLTLCLLNALHCVYTGRALVATHEYHRAVEFYESAIRELNKAMSSQAAAGPGGSKGSATNSSTGAGNDLVLLSHDLSKLYIKLGEFTFILPQQPLLLRCCSS